MDGFPEKYHILPTAEQIINKVKRAANFLLHQETELCLSEHCRGSQTGDSYLEPQLPFDGRIEPHAVSEGWLAYDSEGNYLDRDF